MSRWLLPLGAGLALGIVALLGVLSVGTAGQRTAEQRAQALAAELRCPDCQGLSVADSPTRSAQEIRRQIDELVAAGASDDEVRAHFTARYGEWIRLAPSAPLLWIVPFGAVAVGVVLLGARLARRRPAVPATDRTASAIHVIEDDERRRLREEAEALDA